MSSVGRYVKMTAREGEGNALAQLMLRIADGLKAVPGCELYIINRSPAELDVVWITELWRSQGALDASLEALRTEARQAQLAEVSALLDGPPARIEVEALGGVGYPPHAGA